MRWRPRGQLRGQSAEQAHLAHRWPGQLRRVRVDSVEPPERAPEGGREMEGSHSETSPRGGIIAAEVRVSEVEWHSLISSRRGPQGPCGLLGGD